MKLLALALLCLLAMSLKALNLESHQDSRCSEYYCNIVCKSCCETCSYRKNCKPVFQQRCDRMLSINCCGQFSAAH